MVGLVQEPMPSKVVIQILRRHTLKAEHPAFQPAVVGIHILDVVNPCRLIGRGAPDLNTRGLTDDTVGRGPVGAEDCVLRQPRQQMW